MNATLLRRFFRLFAVSTVMLALLVPVAVRAADQLMLTLNMVEYSYPAGRTGTIRIYRTANPSPLATNPNLVAYNTGLWVVTNWNSLGTCYSSFLAGGQQDGWLLGPETDIATIRSMHPTATVAYGVITGQFGDNGWASRYACNGASITEQMSVLYAFLLPQAQYVQGQGYHVGDAWYATDYSPEGNWYYLYSSSPL